nr:YdbH domain-containing protein [Gammaproteobacteria bacterium]
MVGGLVGGVIVAGALALALAAALAGLPGWLGERASALVREVGYPEAVVTVERVGLDGLEGRLRLGDEGAAGGQGVERVRVDYSPAGLWARRLDRVAVSGVRLGLRVGPNGVELTERQRADEGPPGSQGPTGELSLPLTELILEDVVLTLATPAGDATVPLSGRLEQPEPGRFQGRLDLRLAPEGPRATVELQALAGPSGLTADIDARADLAGVVAMGAEPHVLGGEARLRARLGQGPSGVEGSAELRLAGGSLTGPIFSAREISALVHASSLRPLATPPGQWVSVGALDLGVPLRNGVAAFQIGRGGALVLEQAEFHWAGGRLRLLPTTFAAGQGRKALVMEAAGIGLDQVLALFQVEGLEASGTLHGRVPVTLEGETVRVEGGRLVAAGAGHIRYDPAEPPAFLVASADSGTAVLREALRNFHYDELA